MKLSKLFILLLCMTLVVQLSGCSVFDEAIHMTRSRDKVVEMMVLSTYQSDTDTLFTCLGAAKKGYVYSLRKVQDEHTREQALSAFPDLLDKLKVTEISYEELTGNEKEIAMKSLQEYLNNSLTDGELEFRYTIADVTEIRRASFVLQYNDETIHNVVYMIHTHLGWFAVSIDMY